MPTLALGELIGKLRCVKCGHGNLVLNSVDEISCPKCRRRYKVKEGIPVMLDNENVKGEYNVKVFENHAGKYDKWFEILKGGVLFKNEVKALKLLLKDVDIGESVEIGVGTGRFAQALGVKYGLDPAFKPLLFAKERGIIVVQGVAENLPFRDETFDSAIMIVTICFVKDLERSLREANRILRKGGNIVIGYIDRETKWGKLYLEKKRSGHLLYKNVNFYTFTELKEFLEKTGFKIEKITSTLSQEPTENPVEEEPKIGTKKGGFVTILAKKIPK